MVGHVVELVLQSAAIFGRQVRGRRLHDLLLGPILSIGNEAHHA